MINRKQLDEIILKNNVKDWWIPELFVQNTKPMLPAELEILADPPEEKENHNCFAYALGFEYPTYFNNFFKKITGTNPKSLRVQEV